MYDSDSNFLLYILFCCDQHPDHYSRTKALAEMAVMAADGSHVKTNKKNKKKPGECDCLHTCALRLAGVYGPGERRHLPRIVVIYISSH